MAEVRVHTILGVRVDDLTAMELRERLRQWLREGARRTVVTPNPEIILLARRDAHFRDLLNGADLSLPDGVGLTYAVAALSGERLEHRQTGVDVLEELAALCAKEGKNLLLFGGQKGTAAKAAKTLQERYAGLMVRAHEPGEIAETPHGLSVPHGDLDTIRVARPEVIAVGLGQGKQERFIAECVPSFPSIRVAVGVGGAFAMLGGSLPRAPKALRRAGLEWLWRLMLEPWRLPRILRATVVFPAVVAWDTLKRHRFLRAALGVAREFFRRR